MTIIHVGGEDYELERLSAEQAYSLLWHHVLTPNYSASVAERLASQLWSAREGDHAVKVQARKETQETKAAEKKVRPIWPPTRAQIRALAKEGLSVVAIAARLRPLYQLPVSTDRLRDLLANWHTTLKELREERDDDPTGATITTPGANEPGAIQPGANQ